MIQDSAGLARTYVDDGLEEAVKQNLPLPLQEPCLHLINAGGKRARGMIPPLVCAAVGGNPWDALSHGLAIELIHTFTLIHDDIMDNETVRRGVEAVHQKFGIPTAINAGNALFALAIEILVGEGSPMVMGVVLDAAIELAGGQQLDLDNRGQPMTYKQYEEIIQMKTVPLFKAAAGLGAMIGEADMETLQHMESWGYNFGMSFQARDDVLDKFELIEPTNGFQNNLQAVAHRYGDLALADLEILPESEWKELLVQMTKDQVDRTG